jgi:3-hydroxyacyl-CoA dehydrogenase/enoyl-CoA hydratase/3-hydroxybutyryl-CoA epimerase/3-hydroxyacyl-CoA dehydrogenase/enoyl-CoA hydratase/3-hydroxybutyryl-CoA epimerase/enoyl-CoA isomerase
VIQQGCSLPLEEGLKLEQEAFLDLMGTPIPANLLAVFFMKQRLARDPGFSAPGVPARHTQKVGVLGAGLTGSGIAAVHASSGIPTVLVDPDQERMAHGLVGLRTIMVEQIISGRAVPQDMAGMLDQLNTSPALEILADCDLVIETIPGDEAFHRELYQALAAVLGSGTILASNTSTLSITPLARSAPHAERFLGIHFFHPVHRMQLVEVVRGETTTDETIATAVALARRLGKTPIVVHDGTGFLINRILFSYLNEAVLLLLEGAAQAAIDQAATRFGMPMGPLLLHDVIGLDTVCSIHGALLKAYGNRTVPLPILADLAAGGRLGQKSGAGFRKYDTAHRKGVPDPDFRPYLERHRIDHRDISDDEITNRLFLSMLLEATRALEENIAREPAHVDMGLILGTGFPAFRGGILRWCDTEGVGRIMQRVSKYYSLGKRFQPTAILERLAGSAGRFYS